MQSCATGRRRVPIMISGTPVLTARAGEAYAGFTVAGSGGTAPYVYSLVGTWPAGITINPVTGVVSGTPTQAGHFFGLSVRAVDRLRVPAQLAPFALQVAALSTGTAAGSASVLGVGLARFYATGTAAGSASVIGSTAPPPTDFALFQQYVEIVSVIPDDVRLAQQYVEVVTDIPDDVRLVQQYVEIVTDYGPY